MASQKKNQKKLESINSFFNAIKDYFLFLVALSSSFEILATILEGLIKVEPSSKLEMLAFEFPFLFNLSSAGLILLFIGGLIPSTLGLFSISFGRKFIAQEDITKSESVYLLVKKLATTASICFLIGFSLISTQTLFESIINNGIIIDNGISDNTFIFLVAAPVFTVFFLIYVIGLLVRIIVRKDNDQ